MVLPLGFRFICNVITGAILYVITDGNGGPNVNFENTAYTVGEGNESVQVCLLIRGLSLSGIAYVTVDLEISMGDNSMYLTIAYISYFRMFS